MAGQYYAAPDSSERQNPATNTQIDCITEAQEALLLSLPDASLYALVMRSLAAYGAIAAMTEEQTAQAMLDILAETALRPITPGINIKADIQSRLNAIDKWLDRTRGKPSQSIVQDVNLKGAIAHVQMSEEETQRILDDWLSRDVKTLENKAAALPGAGGIL